MVAIFLSHSSRDQEDSAALKSWLADQGFEQLFLDFDKHSGIPPGADWEKTLYREVARSEAVVIVLTPNWLESKWCFVEFAQARALGKEIFPLVAAPLGDRSFAEDIQRLDLCGDRASALEQLAAALRRLSLDTQGGFSWETGRSPYPGLLSFQEEDAAVYFGRTEERRRLIESLNARRVLGGAKLIALLGASGSGKSSLMRAGVIPHLKRDRRNWIVLPPFRPQEQPLHEMARAFATALNQGRQWRSIYAMMTQDDTAQAARALVADLHMATGNNEAQIFIPIDQGEELFPASDPMTHQDFFALLSQFLAESLPCFAVVSIRADYLGPLQSAAGLEVPFEEFSLKPLPTSRIEQIIEGPARVAGLTVERALVAQAMQDAETQDALPLLAFTLRELFERFGGDGDLTAAEYEALGDPEKGLTPLENAVRNAADRVLLQEKPNDVQLQALRDAFVPSLARINDEGEYVRRTAHWDDLPPLAKPLLEKLTNARLLVMREAGGERLIEVAHEALLRKWSRLRAWLDEDREFLIWINGIAQEAERWEDAPPRHKGGVLLKGWPLAQARSWLEKRGGSFEPQIRAFVERSVLAVYYRNLSIAIALLIVLPLFLIDVAEGYLAQFFRTFHWLADPISLALLRMPILLRSLDLMLLLVLLMLFVASVLRAVRKRREG